MKVSPKKVRKKGEGDGGLVCNRLRHLDVPTRPPKGRPGKLRKKKVKVSFPVSPSTNGEWKEGRSEQGVQGGLFRTPRQELHHII